MTCRAGEFLFVNAALAHQDLYIFLLQDDPLFLGDEERPIFCFGMDCATRSAAHLL